MTGERGAWSRLANASHVRRTLVDLSSFLVAYAALVDYCVRRPHGFLSEPAELISTYDARDQRIARCDPDRPTTGDVADAIAFFVDGGAFTAADARRIAALGERRADAVHRAQYLLAEDTAAEFLTATLDLRDLLRKASRWWFVQVEAAIQPATLAGSAAEDVESKSMVEAVVDSVLRVAQDTAEPGA